jgi:vacuolar-type H+-ATPase subunit C/Vma6
MPGAGERAYAYAKACGIIGKSFIGRRMAGLSAVSRLSELDRLVFPGSSRDLPEKELLFDLEGRIISRAVKSITAIVDCFSKPPEFLSLLVRSYEYADLKTALSAPGETKKPAFTDLGRFNTVRFDLWPDIPAMIRGSEFEFLLDKDGSVKKEADGISLQTQLDRHYYERLWKSLVSLPQKDRAAAETILSDEISLRNSGWVLRLRSYYEMPPEELKAHLIDIRATRAGKGSLAADAYACLEFSLENRAEWSSWRWARFLNPERGGQWRADPRYFQNAASGYLYRLARKHFRVHPFSLDTVFCFIKLKQFEEDILTSNAEGLGMGMSSRDVFGLLEVEA